VIPKFLLQILYRACLSRLFAKPVLNYAIDEYGFEAFFSSQKNSPPSGEEKKNMVFKRLRDSEFREPEYRD